MSTMILCNIIIDDGKINVFIKCVFVCSSVSVQDTLLHFWTDSDQIFGIELLVKNKSIIDFEQPLPEERGSG